MVKVQRLFAKTNLKIQVWRIEKIGIFMCKGETIETTCDRYTKRNNR